MAYPDSFPASALERAARSPVLLQHDLSGETSFRIGGPARYFCAPPDPAALVDLWRAARVLEIPVRVLGGGTNVLFEDAGFDGLVLSTRSLDTCETDAGGMVRAGAGLTNATLTAVALERGLAGFEWASGLPGTIGGGIVMNARCYGGAFADLLVSAEALTPHGRTVTLTAAECRFGYKQSVFQAEGWVLTGAVLRLTPGDPAAIRKAVRKHAADRQRKGQFDFPSAGCVFKNDYTRNLPAGRLIEACGFKGRKVGGAQVYSRHANFIINTGGATARDVLALITLIEQTVRETHGVVLERELRVIARRSR